MTEKERLDKIIKLATEGYDTAANCFSNIVTETIQEHGDVRTLTKFSAPVLVRVFVSRIHAIGQIKKKEDLMSLSRALKDSVRGTFPIPKDAPKGLRPGPVLDALITIAVQYQMVIIRATQRQQGLGELRDLSLSQAELQLAYSGIMEWTKQYPILATLESKNNIADIGVLITAIIRESKEEVTEIRRRGGTTRIMPAGIR